MKINNLLSAILTYFYYLLLTFKVTRLVVTSP